MISRDPPAIGGYAIDDVIARGGMAVVYKALDAHGNVVALKRILPETAGEVEFRERFRHEVKIHSQLDHPNVIALHSYGESPDGPFIAMEFMDGGSLRALLDKIEKLPAEEAVFVAREICLGLGAAHARGVVHRDVKPQNVLLSKDGAVKVADFGISKGTQMTQLTMTGNVVGTPAYMSPEQATARTLGPASDLFSAGVLLYEALSGTNPFITENAPATLRRVLEHHPPSLFESDPTLPPEVDLLVDRLLRKDPLKRIQDASAAVALADRILVDLGVPDGRAELRDFLADPPGHTAKRRRVRHEEHFARAHTLVRSGTASDEVALWEAFLASRLDPSSEEARILRLTLERKTGYRLDGVVPSARAREMEERLHDEPDSVPLLLQLAKLAKLEHDFLRTMRFFFRLRKLPVEDAYLQGQIASIVSRPAASEGPVEVVVEDPSPRAGVAPSPKAGAAASPPPLPPPARAREAPVPRRPPLAEQWPPPRPPAPVKDPQQVSWPLVVGAITVTIAVLVVMLKLLL